MGRGGHRKEETQSDFGFLTTAFFLSLSPLRPRFTVVKFLFVASFTHPATSFLFFVSMNPRGGPWGLHSSSFITDVGMKLNGD